MEAEKIHSVTIPRHGTISSKHLSSTLLDIIISSLDYMDAGEIDLAIKEFAKFAYQIQYLESVGHKFDENGLDLPRDARDLCTFLRRRSNLNIDNDQDFWNRAVCRHVYYLWKNGG